MLQDVAMEVKHLLGTTYWQSTVPKESRPTTEPATEAPPAKDPPRLLALLGEAENIFLGVSAASEPTSDARETVEGAPTCVKLAALPAPTSVQVETIEGAPEPRVFFH